MALARFLTARRGKLDEVRQGETGQLIEVDISSKVNKTMKYGALAVLILALGIAAAVFSFQRHDRFAALQDAYVTGALVNAAPQVAGTVEDILINEGDMVEAGRDLAVLKVKISPEQMALLEKDAQSAKAHYEELLTRPQPAQAAFESGGSLSGARAELERAQREREKMDRLFAIGGISALQHQAAQAAYEAAQASYEAARRSVVTVSQGAFGGAEREKLLQEANLRVQQTQKALEDAQKNLQSARIEAAVDGVVYFNGVQKGDAVKAGQVVFRVGDLREMWIEATVTQKTSEALQLGQFAEYSLDEYPNRVFSGTVCEIRDAHSDGEDPAAEKIVRISMPMDLDMEIRPGMKARGKISM